MNNNIQKYQWGKGLKWLSTSLDDGIRFVRKPFVAKKYAKMGVDVTTPQNQRIIASLSGLDFGNNLQMDIPTWTLRHSLIDQGVDPRLLSELNLYKLVNKRINALDLGLNFPSKYAVRYDLGWDFPHNEYHLFRGTPLGGNRVGTLSTSTRINGDHTINMISNITSGKKRVSGISEQGYNAAIQDLGDLISGEVLMSPHITTRVWDKFPTKTLLGNYGRHHYPNADAAFEWGPIWRLEAPTYKQPIKFGNNFDVMSITPNGRFTVDFNKGPMFKYGGKIEKFWPGGIIKNGLKYVWNYGSDLINATKLNHVIKTTDISKAVRQSNLFDSHMKLTHNLLDSSPLFVKPTKAVSWADLGIDTSKPWVTQFMSDWGPLKSADDLLKKYPDITIDPKIGADVWTIGKVDYSRPNFYVQHGDLLKIDGVNYHVGPVHFPAAKTNTLVHQGDVNIINGVMYPKPSNKGGTTAIWWEQNQPFYGPWSTSKSTFIIDDVVPTRLQPDVFGNIKTTRLTDAVDLKDPKLNFKFVRFDPISGELVRSPFVFQTKPINYNYQFRLGNNGIVKPVK